ncbi:PIN domain-like protein [Tilletiaria anomala UBC 951]|uniref:PIN domain-like protein n=1 Tax=Tilletiaria anomala (strain ATCC 24038 / CBS 436.72 / UBC 951) TaxID=1037660 RepID=A0A066WR69_TILAU|nr:PIN domain-like protein [Tilletiaria anomala UBC 951]KDN53140.1 PIN domain-like protein [Tilletiaria anomala UBC 951]
MGVTGLWNHLDHACTISSLEDEAWRYYRASPYKALRLGIDSSLWMFHGKGLPGEVGPNASLRMIFYRLVNLFSLPILPVFVFDGPRKPSFKRGKETSRALHWKAQKETDEFKLLIRAFGFLERTAPGEAEAELAWMNEHNIIDVVLTDDVDVLLFGAKRVFRNAGAGLPGTLATKKRHMARTLSNESNGLAGPSRRQASGKYLKSQDMPMYTVKKAIAVDKNKPCESCQGWLMSAYASDTEEGDASGDESRDAEDEELNLPLDREGLILIACLSGGDYNLSGVISCGPTISKVLASLGFGTRLVNVLKASVASDAPPVPSYEGPRWMPRLELNEALWRRQRDAVLAEICQELETNESGLLHKRQKAVAQKVRDNFLTTPDSVSVLASYIWPNTTLHCLKLGCTSAQFELDWTKSGDASHLTENTFDVDRIDRSSALEWSSTQDTMCLDLILQCRAPSRVSSWLLIGIDIMSCFEAVCHLSTVLELHSQDHQKYSHSA